MYYRRRRWAFTLVELLVVVAIVTILTALLFPVLAMARKRAARTTCTSNLHQLGIALNMYLETADGEYPATIVRPWKPILWKAVTPIIKMETLSARSGILKCPLDTTGRTGLPDTDRTEPISYYATWFLWNYHSGYEAWQRLTILDPNPIVLRCYFHDDRQRNIMLSDRGSFGKFNNAASNVLRKDGSVSFERKPDRAPLLVDDEGRLQQDYKLDHWMNASEVPCPQDICDGKRPSDVDE